MEPAISATALAPQRSGDTPQAALARLYMLPGAQYVDPNSVGICGGAGGVRLCEGRGWGPNMSRTCSSRVTHTLLNGYLSALS